MNFVLATVRRLAYPISSLWAEESNRNQRLRRLGMFLAWQIWRRVIRRPLPVSLFNGARFLAYPDCHVSSGVIYTRIPNSRNILFLRQHLSGGTLIDVGANVGSVSLLLSDKIEHAILFEPNRLAAARAQENLARNGLRFEVHELALSDTNGEIAFEGHGGVDTVSHVVVSGEATLPCRSIVQRITLDEFLAKFSRPHPPISIIKIDVEGHENSVLRGMERCLLTERPPLIMFEYLQRTNIEETFRFFKGVRYQVFELTKTGPVAVSDKVEPLQDLFACPQEYMSAMGVTKIA